MHTNTHTQHDEHVEDRYWRNLGIYRSKTFETEEEARDFWYTLQFGKTSLKSHTFTPAY